MLRSSYLLALLAGAIGAQAQNIVQGEYFFDQDNGFGAAGNVAFEITDAPSATLTLDPVSLTGLDPGVHTLGIRTKDENGRWSHTNFTSVLIVEPPPPVENLVQVEYFLDQDPGWNAGDTAWQGATTDLQQETFTADLGAVDPGVHTLFLRSRTADGRWSHTNHTSVLVVEPPEPLADIVEVEYFWSADPGFGQALDTMVATPQTNLIEFNLEAIVPQPCPGIDTLFLRSRDAEGRWSHTNHLEVNYICTSVQELGSHGISAFPNPFADHISIQTSDGQPFRVALYDPTGKKVYDQLLNGPQRIDLSGHASGAYTAFFWKEADVIHRVTLIKQ